MRFWNYIIWMHFWNYINIDTLCGGGGGGGCVVVVGLVLVVVVEEEKPWAERRGGEEREGGGQDRTAEAKIRPRERKQAKLNPTQAIQSKTIHKTRRQAGGFNPWTAAQL